MTYENTRQLFEEGSFWKKLGRHDRAYRFFTEATECEPSLGAAWTERLESAAIWMGSATLVREFYKNISQNISSEDKAYTTWCEQSVEFAYDATTFRQGLHNIKNNASSEITKLVGRTCHEQTGMDLDALLASDSGDEILMPLLAEFHINFATNAMQPDAAQPPGVIAIHSILAASALNGTRIEDEQGILMNAQDALLKCHEAMAGMARSHGSIVTLSEAYSLQERIRILEKLDRDYCPDDPLTLNRLGTSHLLMHQSDAAIAAFKSAFELEQRPKPLINWASALNQKGWRIASIDSNFGIAKRCYEEAIELLEKAATLSLEKGDAAKIESDKQIYIRLQASMSENMLTQYPSRLIGEMKTGQASLADKYMRMYREEGADSKFVAKQVKRRFKLGKSEQALQCTKEMLEDFCPGFIATIVLELGSTGHPLVKAMGGIARDADAGVMSKDARETMALLILCGGDSMVSCAASIHSVSTASGIQLRELQSWTEEFLEPGFGQSVYYLAKNVPADQLVDNTKSGSFFQRLLFKRRTI